MEQCLEVWAFPSAYLWMGSIFLAFSINISQQLSSWPYSLYWLGQAALWTCHLLQPSTYSICPFSQHWLPIHADVLFPLSFCNSGGNWDNHSHLDLTCYQYKYSIFWSHPQLFFTKDYNNNWPIPLVKRLYS